MADIVSILQAVNFAIGAQDPKRVPLQWQSVMREARGEPPLLMRVNPQQVQFQQGKRIQKQDTRGGTTYFHFANKAGQNNDVLTLQLSGTTGNIDPRAVTSRLTAPSFVLGDTQVDLSGDRTGALDKLKAWISFYELTLEPILDPLTGQQNLVTLTYHSPIFRKPVEFTGHFAAVLNFPETAQEPFQRTWNVAFTVQRTDPSLDTLGEYLFSTIINAPVDGA